MEEYESFDDLSGADSESLAAQADTSFKLLRFPGGNLRIVGDPSQRYLVGIERWPQDNKAFLAALSELSENTICLDVGANIGITSCLLARSVPDGKVYAFEPCTKAVGFLRQNLKHNTAGNAFAITSAVSDATGAIAFGDRDETATSHVVTPEYPGNGAVRQVDMISLDDWINGQKDFGRVGFIKIDVEGFEPNVLAGAAQLIARDRPIILMEFNSWCLNAFHGYSPAAFMKALMQSFHVHVFKKSGVFVREMSPLSILYSDMVEREQIDLLLKPVEHVSIPPLADLVRMGKQHFDVPPLKVRRAPRTRV